MTAGRSSEDGGRFAGGHFAGGHDGMANLCKPITAYDFHVRYSYNNWRIMSKPHYAEKVKRAKRIWAALFGHAPGVIRGQFGHASRYVRKLPVS